MASPTDSLTPSSIVFPTLSLIAILLDVPPLVWHVRNRNVAACNLISWTVFANLCNLVNALIWPTDNISTWFSGYVLCDIEAKLLLAATFGIAGSLVCIMRGLAKVLDTENTVMGSTKKQRYKEFIITSLLCFGGPLYIMLIHYVVQPTRYYILAIAGCTTSIDNSWPAIVLVIIWPVVLCLMATFHGLLVMFRMRKYRKEFSSVLTASNSSLTQSRFLRLFLLSFLLVLIFLPFQLYVFYLNVSGPLLPYSWDLVHGPAWMDIIMIPRHGVVPLDRWITIVLGVLLFLFFGLGSDATKMYRKFWLKLRLGSDSLGLDEQSTLPHAQSPSMSHDNGSLTSMFMDFCRKRLSSRRSSTSQSEKRNTVTTTSTLASPIEAEKMSRVRDFASPTIPTSSSHSPVISSNDMPLPLVPAQSKFSWLTKYMNRTQDTLHDDDIESALERHENHQPSRFIAGLWHVNNTVNATGARVAPGICTGNCNGLKL